jgi:hypothetical protein
MKGNTLDLPAALDLRTFDLARTAPQGGYYVFPHVFYDTFTYLLAGLAGLQLPVFGNPPSSADVTLTNWPGVLPIAHKFHGLKLYITPLTRPSTVAVAAPPAAPGRWDDVDAVRLQARTVISFDLPSTGRRRPPIDMSAVSSMPGVQGQMGIASTVAADRAVVQAVGQVGDGKGFPIDIPLTGGESFTLTFLTRKDQATAISADLQFRVQVAGHYYIPVG